MDDDVQFISSRQVRKAPAVSGRPSPLATLQHRTPGPPPRPTTKTRNEGKTHDGSPQATGVKYNAYVKIIRNAIVSELEPSNKSTSFPGGIQNFRFPKTFSTPLSEPPRHSEAISPKQIPGTIMSSQNESNPSGYGHPQLPPARRPEDISDLGFTELLNSERLSVPTLPRSTSQIFSMGPAIPVDGSIQAGGIAARSQVPLPGRGQMGYHQGGQISHGITAGGREGREYVHSCVPPGTPIDGRSWSSLIGSHTRGRAEYPDPSVPCKACDIAHRLIIQHHMDDIRAQDAVISQPGQAVDSPEFGVRLPFAPYRAITHSQNRPLSSSSGENLLDPNLFITNPSSMPQSFLNNPLHSIADASPPPTSANNLLSYPEPQPANDGLLAESATMQEAPSEEYEHSKNIYIDLAETVERILPIDEISRRHSVTPARVLDVLQAIVQLPLLRNAADKRRASPLAQERMKDHRDAKRAKLADSGASARDQRKKSGGSKNPAPPTALELAPFLPDRGSSANLGEDDTS